MELGTTNGVNTNHLQNVVNASSLAVTIPGGFSLGITTQTLVYVSSSPMSNLLPNLLCDVLEQVTSNGFFSFGREAHLHNPVLFPESVFYNHLIAPYWVNSDIRLSGRISYEVHTSMTGLMSQVNNFIQQEDDEEFVGTWMMVATFSEVPQLDSTSNEVGNFLSSTKRRHTHVTFFIL